MDPGRRPAPRPVDVIHFPDDRRPPRWQHPVLALGNFDGLHRGHIKIIERVRRVATERAATALVMTFDPHPPRVVRPDKAPPLLMTKAQRLEGIERAGLDGVAVVRRAGSIPSWRWATSTACIEVTSRSSSACAAWRPSAPPRPW